MRFLWKACDQIPELNPLQFAAALRMIVRPRPQTRSPVITKENERMRRPAKIAPPKGKLGVLTVGLGAVSTTFMAGVDLVRSGAAQPVGSLTQLGTIRLRRRTR